MKRRVNLFKGQEGATPKRSAQPALPWLIGLLILSLPSLLFVQHRAQKKRLLAQLRSLEAQHQTMVSRSPATPTLAPTGPIYPSSSTQSSWLPFVWIVSNFTRDQIKLKRVQISKAKTKEDTASNTQEAVIEGSASSSSWLQSWLGVLILRLPTYQFALDREERKKDPDFPLEFRIRAKQI